MGLERRPQKAQTAARDLEHRYHLHHVAPADRTSHRRPKPAEQNKAARQRRAEIPRDQLRRHVRTAAAAATNQTEFFRHLRAHGVLIRLRHSTTNPRQVTGYAVGLPLHRTGAGDTVWYGGGRLAPDLTLPAYANDGPTTVIRRPAHISGQPRSTTPPQPPNAPHTASPTQTKPPRSPRPPRTCWPSQPALCKAIGEDRSAASWTPSTAPHANHKDDQDQTSLPNSAPWPG
ncbi:hypothetical protein Psuf_042880 [Phytohabitans suffuscus]|uniref:Uncharacterized protein n=1 Tax=Phytohabitans suffuscus TaxID=624315 RepID=A0A6F8YLF8_9ACTN|nr:hypothetical protein Psuf_042880 [Phytohabitans suffuscus]